MIAGPGTRVMCHNQRVNETDFHRGLVFELVERVFLYISATKHPTPSYK